MPRVGTFQHASNTQGHSNGEESNYHTSSKGTYNDVQDSYNGRQDPLGIHRRLNQIREERVMVTREEKRRADLLETNKEVKKQSKFQRDFDKGELVEATVDYISDEWPHPKPPKKYGIVLDPKTSMYSDDKAEYATRVQWADNSEEVVWQFEIQGVVKNFQEKK